MAQSPRWLPLLLVFLSLVSTAHAASFPPSYRFRAIEGARVTVYFHQGLETAAREAVALATEILERHEARYGRKVGRVRIVLADNEDDPNGFATPLPYPLVNVRMVAPDGSDEFGNHDGWLRLVLSHELAHVVHLDQARGVMGFGRKLLGRAPFLFPNVFTPTWLIEGLATYEETQTTAFGRGRNPDSRMVVRMSALEDRFLHEDQATYGFDAWPGGQAPYLFGEEFLRELTAKQGEAVLPALARKQSGKIIPYLDDFTAREVMGSSFHAQWEAWADRSRAAAEEEADGLRRHGITSSRALTTRGVRQWEPRFSPDGSWIAYSSRTLTRFPSIRLVRSDGTEDRHLADRNGGSGLSWTPDGKTIVYAEAEVRRFFSVRSDLRAVDVASGRVRKVSRGLRARDPDVSPDGASIVFARQMGDRSELYSIGLDGKDLRALTESAPGTEWSGPVWSPRGDQVAASRLLPGGWLDVVLVDVATRAVSPLTEDRAKDVEPAWAPDGGAVVFRSDRDGRSNLYAVRLEDRRLVRLTNVLGGAFTPSVDPSGREVAFSLCSSRGYDVHVAALDIDGAPAAEPFDDPYPPAHAPVTPVDAKDEPYRPLGTLWPRFWTPVAYSGGGEWKIGAATGGSDPLFRHFWGATATRGTESDRFNYQGFYQYDRFFPTLLLSGEDTTDVRAETRLRTRTFNARLTFPVRRTLRSSQSVSVAWRREDQATLDLPRNERLGLGGLEAAWTLSSVKVYPYSISPVDGTRLRVAYLREDPAFGSDLSLSKTTLDGRLYLRAFGEADAFVLRGQGGFTRGEPDFRRSFTVGGFPDSGLFDLVDTNMALLRGYPDDAFAGRAFASANVEYRFPLGHPQRGWRTLPVFLRNLHGTVFFDAAHAWTGEFRLEDVSTAAGVAVATDTYIGYRLPFTAEVGVGHGFDEKGETRVYFRFDLTF
jgi:Omp85 superfamily domain/WD40-like Beta Propeller Repeat